MVQLCFFENRSTYLKTSKFYGSTTTGSSSYQVKFISLLLQISVYTEELLYIWNKVLDR